MFTCATCGTPVCASEAVAHSKACTEAQAQDCIDLTVSPPAKSARGAREESPQARRRSEAAPGSCLEQPLEVDLLDSPPRRSAAVGASGPTRRALAAVQQPAATFEKALRGRLDDVLLVEPAQRRAQLQSPLLLGGARQDDVLLVEPAPLRRAHQLQSPLLLGGACLDDDVLLVEPLRRAPVQSPLLLDDDDDELPRAPWSRAPAPRPAAAAPAAAAPASERKVAATLWPDDDDGVPIKVDSDGECTDECTDESAAAAEAALKNFGHLGDAPLDQALLVDVHTRLKLHQLIFCRWARDRPAVLLGDDMGLGKTLQAFALCRARMPPSDWSGAGTLIVVPKSLLTQWKKEFSKHLGGVHGGLHLFYGAKKTSDPARLRRYEFVVTTYETVRNAAAAPRAGASGDADEPFADSPLAQLTWWRIILDEAHVARNRSTRLCAALCGLRTERRVALSGTPIQNGLADIYSLLRWLKVPGPLQLDAPDTSSGEALALRTWKSRVSTPLTGKKQPQARAVAFGLLNAVLSDVLIRRVKKDTIRGQPLIVLPSLTYDDQTVAFSADEKAMYETLWSDAVACFNRHLKKGDVLKHYIMFLVKLLRLRQCCAHPALVVERRDVCGACHKPLGNGGSGELRIAPCGHKFCAECIEACVEGKRPPTLATAGRGRGRGRSRAGGRSSGGRGGSERKALNFESDDELEPAAGSKRQGCKCPLPDCDEWLTRADLAPLDADAGDESAISRPLGAAAGGHEMSTKIAMLLKGLQALPKGAKSLVFSQWTSLLSIVHPFLTAAGIDAERLDGSMSMEERSAAVDRFTDDDNCSVFMLSLKAGGVGLHLVAATHVWLLDPWWNPMVEEQAFQRCHRLGQKNPVVIHRLYIQETVEQAVVSLQGRKRGLADSTLNADIAALNALSVEDLKLLFSRPPPAAAAGGAPGGA